MSMVTDTFVAPAWGEVFTTKGILKTVVLRLAVLIRPLPVALTVIVHGVSLATSGAVHVALWSAPLAIGGLGLGLKVPPQFEAQW
jgi:ABC-type cobalamin transport system permease subunit